MITKNVAEWSGTKRWLEEQIEDARQQLEAPGVDVDQSNVLRGRIAAHRHMIETVESPPVVEQSPGYVA